MKDWETASKESQEYLNLLAQAQEHSKATDMSETITQGIEDLVTIERLIAKLRGDAVLK